MNVSTSRFMRLQSCVLCILSFVVSYASLVSIGYLISAVGVAGLSLALILVFYFRDRRSPWWRKSLWVGGLAAVIPALIAVVIASQL